MKTLVNGLALAAGQRFIVDCAGKVYEGAGLVGYWVVESIHATGRASLSTVPPSYGGPGFQRAESDYRVNGRELSRATGGEWMTT